MFVIQVTPGYPPSQGGVETHVEAISERLSERGHKVTVVSADAGIGDRRERQEGVVIRRCRSIAPGGAYHFAPGVTPAVRRLDPDVVHIHNYHALTLPAAAVACRDARLVVTPHYHGGSASRVRDALLRLYRSVGGRALRSADAVVAVSEWEREQLAADFGVDATVVPNGIEVNRFADALPYDHDRPYLLCVGRLEKYKGVQHAIRALPDLPNYDLLVAGSGPYRADLERIAERTGVAERVDFRGYVPDDALPGLYAGAEVFLALSSFEAFGLTVGEALAAGTPCVVQRRGALDDWERYDGVVGIEEVEPDTVRDAIARAQSSSVESGAVPRWDDHVDRLLQIYRRDG